MRFTTVFALVHPILTLAAIHALSPPSTRADESNVQATATSSTVSDSLSDLPADPSFDRCFDVLKFASAFNALDADAAVDQAFQLCSAERVLLRQRNGISSDEVLEIALRIAIETGNESAAIRLQSGAAQFGRTEFSNRIGTVSKLSGESRALKIAPVVDLLHTSLDSFRIVKSLWSQARLAQITGNLADAKQLAEHIRDTLSISESQRVLLAQLCTPMLDEKVERPANSLLAKLAGNSRSGGVEGEWDTWYIAANEQRICSRVRIFGDRGTYLAPGCQGQLSNLQTTSPFGGGATILRGRWTFCNGETGFFQWSINGESFTGHWGSDGSQLARQWCGRRIEGVNSGNGNPVDPSDGGLGIGDLAMFNQGQSEVPIDDSLNGDPSFGDSSIGDMAIGEPTINESALGDAAINDHVIGAQGFENVASNDLGNDAPVDAGLGNAGGLGSLLGDEDESGLGSLLGSEWRAANGSTCRFDRSGRASLSDPRTGVRYPGQLRSDSGRIAAHFQEGSRTLSAPIRFINENQVQIGKLLYNRKR